ncbi:hypothetical protein [Pararhizobium mangrovi]|uniref:Uncharacterized protein n=1 Tax=Pararhizobium mangrovi TaxID=2590452 RepID=A0A506TYF7_9HYPH|nr:hypothetical protein [Pararhizobium mangrovi]TPW26011.1 hypothetical protein FJU11_16480 [Pararhizobium mangrovi]
MNVGERAKGLENSAEAEEQGTEVSSVETDGDIAATLMDQVIGQRGIREPVKAMLERAYRDLSRRSPEWTRRRVRAVFNHEANRIEYREIEDMRAVIQARERHAAYRKETARIAQMAAVREAAQDR